jgi:hypothetical protein
VALIVTALGTGINVPGAAGPGRPDEAPWDMLSNGMATGLFMVTAIRERVAPEVFTYRNQEAKRRGGSTMRMYRMLLTFVVGSACLFGALGFAGDAPKPDGTVSAKVESWVPRGEGFGFTWGKGLLRMTNGITQVFTLQGLGVRGNVGGNVDMEARGQVFNLKNPLDFEGTYKESAGDAPAGTDPKALVMKNEQGVVVVLEVKVEAEANPNLTLDASNQDVKVKLER